MKYKLTKDVNNPNTSLKMYLFKQNERNVYEMTRRSKEAQVLAVVVVLVCVALALLAFTL